MADAGERRRHGLRGLRVLEAGHVLAVPLAGALLGALGARVTKLEDLGRIDMYRRNGPYIDQEPGLDRTAYFAFANHSKTNAVLRVEEEPDRLVALLDDADVFLENLGAKRARTLGVAASVALDAHPGVLAISSTGFGQDGPYASYRAYAYNMHASAALGYLTRNADGEPADIDLAWGDLVSAYAVATIVAAWAVGPAGNRGAGLDYAMADAIVSHFPEFLAAASLDPASDADGRPGQRGVALRAERRLPRRRRLGGDHRRRRRTVRGPRRGARRGARRGPRRGRRCARRSSRPASRASPTGSSWTRGSPRPLRHGSPSPSPGRCGAPGFPRSRSAPHPH